ncbi:MAG: multiheme c-type cytochrome [Desulfovibrionaceae bacterium]|nr:hydroxylamine oxidoreductase [Desulfovibrionaceae bacterium]MDD4951469.1 multiheme c-type cytochrome [Desulfovibrionaceae bacterium]
MKGKALLLALFVLSALSAAWPASAQNAPKVKELRIGQDMPKEAVACMECHKRESPGIFADWAMSRHAEADVTCLDCHQAEGSDKDVSKSHFKQYERSDTKWGAPGYRTPVAGAVTPKDCSQCHPDEVEQYAKSKHANTIEIIWKIDPWLNMGMNNDLERATGCLPCHGTVLEVAQDGGLDPLTWPNVGVGRVNLDGSLGSCTSCHTRHRFSVMEARKPGACGQCHLGPDHPQTEIYAESKHGDIADAYGDQYDWEAAPGSWTPGTDYRAPTCAACHMSGSGSVMTSHDVTERLAWELQAPLSVRPQDFGPFPAKNAWSTERDKMKEICRQCHSTTWTDGHFDKADRAVANYNETYFKPAKAKLDELYAKGLLDKTRFFDEALEVEFYELWHHEGRRARMGAAMMAPDYSWWHGFYECKKRYNEFMEQAEGLLKSGKPAPRFEPYPGFGGNTARPARVFGKKAP